MIKSTKELSPLAQKIKNGAFLVDVREVEEFAAGTAEGAVNIPLFTVPLRLEEFKDKKEVIVFCASGGRSYQAQKLLEEQGIESVTNGGSWFDVDFACKELK